MPMERNTKERSRITREKARASELKRLTYPNKKVYQGGFKNDKPDGQGTLFHHDGSVIEGFWKAGKIENFEQKN